MSFSNVYYKRIAGTAKACYVCYKPTTTVLATINTVDFLYTCPGHLADLGFASSLGGVENAAGERKAGLTDEEIAKVKEEWEEKQRKKKEKEKEKEKESEKNKDKKDSDGTKEKESKREDSKSPKIPSSSSTPKTPPTPLHERYALHRDFFAMRQAEHRKRRQTAQAKDLAPRLPGAPSGTVSEEKY
ncbi:VPS4-associated protein 1 [Lyophyllum atratum]|nr:VPS4-associated protein 1 [Lyophyllum atratum]